MAKNVETVFVDVRASIEDAWKCYTEIEHIKHWCFIEQGWKFKDASLDFNPGGHFRFLIEKDDGNCVVDFKGTYNQIVPNKFISFNVFNQYDFRLEFNESIKGTVIIQVIEKEGDIDITNLKFWKQVMKNYKRYVDRLQLNKL